MKTALYRLDAALAPPAAAPGLRITVLLRVAAALIAAADRLAARRLAHPRACSVREVEACMHHGRPATAVYEDGRLVGYIDHVGRL